MNNVEQEKELTTKEEKLKLQLFSIPEINQKVRSYLLPTEEDKLVICIFKLVNRAILVKTPLFTYVKEFARIQDERNYKLKTHQNNFLVIKGTNLKQSFSTYKFFESSYYYLLSTEDIDIRIQVTSMSSIILREFEINMKRIGTELEVLMQKVNEKIKAHMITHGYDNEGFYRISVTPSDFEAIATQQLMSLTVKALNLLMSQIIIVEGDSSSSSSSSFFSTSTIAGTKRSYEDIQICLKCTKPIINKR